MDGLPRNLIGCGARPPRVEWPEGARLALEQNPEAAAIAEADCDVVAHGWRWIDHQSVGEAEERDHKKPLRGGDRADYVDNPETPSGPLSCRYGIPNCSFVGKPLYCARQ